MRILGRAPTSAGVAPQPLLPIDRLDPGTRVEVRNRLDGRWARGFEVVLLDALGCRVRRLSDGGELPVAVRVDDVRPERAPSCWPGLPS